MMRIGIFMGGASLEKEVSFNSGRTIYDYIDKTLYNPIPLFVTEKQILYILPWQFLYRGKISDFEERLENEAARISWEELHTQIDFAYLALHGKYGEDGSIQGLLELLKIPYSGSSILANALATNKIFFNKVAKREGIVIPEEISIRKKVKIPYQKIDHFLEAHKKIIIKPANEGSSFGVSSATSLKEALSGIEKARFINQEEQDVLIQAYVTGKEFTIIAIEKNNQWIIFEPTEIIFEENFFTYEKKYLPGAVRKQTPGRFDAKTKEIIKEQVKKIIRLVEPHDIIRIDGIIDKKNRVYIIDANPFPGTAPNSFTFVQGAHQNISPAQLINIILQNSLERNHLHAHKSKQIKEEKKFRIAIVLGGISNEKEISLESGRNVFYKLPENFYEKTVIFSASNKKFYRLHMKQIVKDTTVEIESSLTPQNEILFTDFSSLFDFVFIALHGGDGENGTFQKKLEEINLPYNGSGYKASHLCMNKHMTLSVLSERGITTTKRLLITKEMSFSSIEREIKKNFSSNTQFIVKPNDDGCSAFVFFAQTIADIFTYISLIFQTNKTECLIEEYINEIELTVGIIGNTKNSIVLPITQTVRTKNLLSLEEKFLPGAGENITPAALLTDQEINYIKKQIKKAYESLNCDGYARIDCFWSMKENKLIILECNTLPALTPATCFFHQTAEIGINPTETLEYIIYLGVVKHSTKNELLNLIAHRNTVLLKKIESIFEQLVSHA